MATWKDSVRVAVTSNVRLNACETTQDGVLLAVGDRLLLTGQMSAPDNGIYVVRSITGSTAVLSRGTDANTSALMVPETTVRVSEGTMNAHSEWVLSTRGAITLGTTALSFGKQDTVVDPRDYGPCPGDTTTDCTIAVLRALDAAQSTTNPSGYANMRELRLPEGAIQISKPLRITSSNFVLSGTGRGTTTIRPDFQGPWCVIGPTFTDLPPVLADGPLLNTTQCNAFHPNQGRDYRINLRACGCGDIGTTSALTIEAWVRIDSTVTSGDLAVIASGMGLEVGYTNTDDVSFIFAITGTFSTDNALYFRTWASTETGTQNIVVHSGTAAIPVGTWSHIAVDWDGSTIRLLINGKIVHSESTTGSPWDKQFIRQKPWEGVWLASASGLSGRDIYLPSSKVTIGPTRGAKESKYSAVISGTSYPVPVAPFPPGSPNDLWVINWDTGNKSMLAKSDVYKGYGPGGRPVWFPIHGSKDLLTSLKGVTIRDLGLYSDRGVQCGGIFTQMTVGWRAENLYFVLPFYGIYSTNNSYESTFRNVDVIGVNNYACMLVETTSGDVLEACHLINANYLLIASGGLFLRGCTFSNWTGVGTAGVLARGALIYFDQCFWDAESQSDLTRGAIFCDGGFLIASQLEIGTGNIVDQPVITLSQSDADVSGLTASAPFTSAVIDILHPPPMLVTVRVHDFGAGAQMVASSLNSPLGKVVVETATGSDALRTLYNNTSKVMERHDTVATSDATPATLSTLTFEPHSSYVLNVEVHAVATNGSARATWKLTDAWTKGALQAAPSHDYAVATLSAGSNVGTPPIGWSAVLTASGRSSVVMQVTGAAGSNITWIAHVTVMRLVHPVVTWTPLELAPAAWYRADVVTGASWTDQSGNDHDATAGAIAPRMTTLGGQPALNFAGGAWFENSLTNLLTPGGSVTVLSVAQAADTMGGFLFSEPRDTRPLRFGLLTGGSSGTYVESNTVNTDVNINAEAQHKPFMAEWSLYPFYPNVRSCMFRMNRLSRHVANVVGVESGTPGFFIGKDGNPWNGVIAELVVLNRPITASERALWEAYVNARYGI